MNIETQYTKTDEIQESQLGRGQFIAINYSLRKGGLSQI